MKVQRKGFANTSLKYAMKRVNLSFRSAVEVKLPRRITLRMITPNTISI